MYKNIPWCQRAPPDDLENERKNERETEKQTNKVKKEASNRNNCCVTKSKGHKRYTRWWMSITKDRTCISCFSNKFIDDGEKDAFNCRACMRTRDATHEVPPAH